MAELASVTDAAAETYGSPGDVAIVSAGSAMFALMAGNIELARSENGTARQRLELLGSAHPARDHLAAIVAASSLMIALADDDLPQARQSATLVYQAASKAADMPLFASVAGSLAHLAHALGESERAAEMLGASAPVRGGEDPTDFFVTKLGAELRTAIGADAYDRAYQRGKALDRVQALGLLDPDRLVG